MLNDNAKKWVDALRSGEYRQTHGALKHPCANGYEYCCLGVACELAANEGIVERAHRGYISKNDPDYTEILLLPQPVMEWLNISNCGGEHLTSDDRIVTLSKLNDSEGYIFEQIADVIESEPKGLFREENASK